MCVGQGNPNQMLCKIPPCEESTGILTVDLDGAKELLPQNFTCHANGKPFPFETDDHVLELSPGQDKVSLHVRLSGYIVLLYSLIYGPTRPHVFMCCFCKIFIYNIYVKYTTGQKSYNNFSKKWNN